MKTNFVKNVWLIYFVLMCLPLLSGHKINVKFKRISLEEGLSQVTINCIIQDKQGFMWFGTQDGLNRYDGYNFKVYQHDSSDSKSLSSNYVLDILEDSKGMIWVGTSGGLNKFNPESGSFSLWQNKVKGQKKVSNNSVNIIFEDSEGFLWTGNFYGGINKLNIQTGQSTSYRYRINDKRSLSNDTINSISEDREGNLWMATAFGLNKFDKKTLKFTQFLYKSGTSDDSLLNNINSILIDRNQIIWCGTNSGLLKFNIKKGIFNKHKSLTMGKESIKIRVIYKVEENILWLGTKLKGLVRFNIKTNEYNFYMHRPDDRYSLSHNSVMSMCIDRGEGLWIGTLEGLNFYDEKSSDFMRIQHIPGDTNSLSNNAVWSVYVDRDNIMWIGTNGGGLNQFNPSNQKFISYQNDMNDPQSISNNEVWAITEDIDKNIWIGTNGGGLNQFNKKTKKFTHYKNQPLNSNSLSIDNIWDIVFDKEGYLWIATNGGGLNRFNKNTGEFLRYKNVSGDPTSLSDDIVFSLFIGSDKELWIGTYQGGLNRFNSQNQTFIRYQNHPDNPKSISNNFVISFLEDKRGDFWIGTNGGLNKLNRKTGEFTIFREQRGFPNDNIMGILEDQYGDLWLSTNKGLVRYNPERKTFKSYDISDGLLSNEFNVGAYYKNRTGRMFFGCINGLVSFNPLSITENRAIPPVIITDFLLFNKSIGIEKVKNAKTFCLEKSINFTREIILKYSDYIFAFEFSALNYRQSEKNLYKYKLEGLDKDWIQTDAKNRRATYTALSNGEYHFKVVASNDDGYWNEEGTSIKVIILPPWWKTWWFKTICVFLGFFLLFILYKIRIRIIETRLQKKNKLEFFYKKYNITSRERDIVELIILDRANKEIEEALYISSHTVKNHINNIFKKVQITNRGGLLLKIFPHTYYKKD